MLPLQSIAVFADTCLKFALDITSVGYFPNEFFAVLNTSFVLLIIYCRYLTTFRKLIKLHIQNFERVIN
jgi:hypothetical protein